MTKTHLKDYFHESEMFNTRVIVAIVAILVLTGVVIARLVFLQIINHAHYTTLSQENRVTLVPIPPPRGIIYDRNGIVLAQNSPSFSLEITLDEAGDMETTLRELGELVALSERDLKRFRREIGQKRRFEAAPLRFNLTEEEMARLAVNRYRFPGVEVVARMTREYPLGSLAVHAIGYVGRINEAELKKLDTNYSGTTHMGKLGVEKAYEDMLHGTVGVEQVETTARGRALRVLGRTPPTAGKNLYLTIDIRLQAAIEGALGDRRGAVVAIEPKTGEVLAFASTPGYDPNLFVNGISSEDYKALQTSLDKPMINRALQGQYPPGSTVKPFYALAGLEYNKVTADDTVTCRGHFQLPGVAHQYRDWKKEGHGVINLEHAVEQSCDVYFYTLALKLGIDKMAEFMTRFGLGHKTGIDIPGEMVGAMPSSAWKRKRYNQPWYGGETLIAGIGQGYVLTTPLQLATITATMANQGVQMKPHLLHAVQEPGSTSISEQKPQMNVRVPVVNEENWRTAVNSMVSVVHGGRGTAYSSIGRTATYKIAGKTGTAQVAGIKQGAKYNESQTPERLRDHALFVAFAPAEAPQIAMGIIVENGGHGSSTAAPVARLAMDYYLKDLLGQGSVAKSPEAEVKPGVPPVEGAKKTVPTLAPVAPEATQGAVQDE